MENNKKAKTEPTANTAKKTKTKSKKAVPPKAQQKVDMRKSAPKKKSNTHKSNTSKKETNMQSPQFEQFSQKGFEQFEDMANTSRSFFEALTKSTTILTNGFQELTKEATSTAQANAEKNMAAAKDLMTSKTMNEMSEKHQSYAQDNWNDTVSFVSTFTEKYTKLCADAAEPLNQQVAKTMKKTASKAA